MADDFRPENSMLRGLYNAEQFDLEDRIGCADELLTGLPHPEHVTWRIVPKHGAELAIMWSASKETIFVEVHRRELQYTARDEQMNEVDSGVRGRAKHSIEFVRAWIKRRLE